MATDTTSPRKQHASVSRTSSAQPGDNQIKLAERGGESFYARGVSWACTHPASDPVGAIPARSRADVCECHQ
jgi:hypothetical protein